MTSISGRFAAKQAVISEVTAASNELVAAVPGKSIRVISLLIVPAASVVVTFEEGGGTDLTGPMTITEPLMLTFESGLFWTSPGEALNILLAGAIQVSGFLTYIEV